MSLDTLLHIYTLSCTFTRMGKSVNQDNELDDTATMARQGSANGGSAKSLSSYLRADRRLYGNWQRPRVLFPTVGPAGLRQTGRSVADGGIDLGVEAVTDLITGRFVGFDRSPVKAEFSRSGGLSWAA
jgi:hypothetical protein